MSYTREGAKKWSDQCQISAFTASVCDPQRRPHAPRSLAHASGQIQREARSPPREAVNYLPTCVHTCAHDYATRTEKMGGGHQKRALALPNAHYPPTSTGLYRFVTSKKRE